MTDREHRTQGDRKMLFDQNRAEEICTQAADIAMHNNRCADIYTDNDLVSNIREAYSVAHDCLKLVMTEDEMKNFYLYKECLTSVAQSILFRLDIIN